jgi:putative ABC transport system permease protein
VLKGRLAGGFKSGWLRSSLVVFQFFISIFLIVGTVVIYKQLNFIQNKKLGYQREQVLVLHNIYPLENGAKAFMEDLLHIPGIEKATMTGYLPTGGYRSDNPFFQDATLDQKKAVSMQNWMVDENYIPALGMQILQGRNFSKDFPTDSTAVIINESAAKMIGSTDLIGKKLFGLKDINKKDLIAYNIIGVVKDFNFNSLREQVTPMALMLKEERGAIAMRVTTKDVSGIVRAVENKWRSVAPGQPFSYSFMDVDFNATYNAEQRIGKIAISFAVFAIFIACLGLLGLATFAAEQRTKEIGIRKVLGASVSNITRMMSKDFLKLVIIAAFIAFPISWWAMHTWLQDFAYRIGISWWVFVAAGCIALLIALATVSFQAIRAALANPVKSLRTE